MLDFIGRTHILILHLPIGILLLAAVMEWANYFKKPEISKTVFVAIYFVGAFSAVMACLSGYLLSSGYSFTEAETNDHFWAGIATASIAVVAFALNFTRLVNYRKWISILIAISLGITGHLGGSLTHGEGFLMPDISADAGEKALVFEINVVESAELYGDIIVPILDNKCISCHGPSKIKGKLRMDSPENLLANGKSGKVLLASNGELIRRVNLPTSNDKHMPPKNKSQLTEDQTMILDWWIENGASFQNKVNETPDYEKIVPIIYDIMADSHDPNSDMKNIAAILPRVKVAAPDQSAMNTLKKDYVVVLPVGDTTNFIEVNFLNLDSITLAHQDALITLSSNIVRLKLSNMLGLQHAAKVISGMKNLTKLYLDGSDISDNELEQLADLPYLDFINLSNSAITNTGLNRLENNLLLTKIYAFESPVTIDSLASGAQVIRGGYTLEILSSDTLRISE